VCEEDEVQKGGEEVSELMELEFRQTVIGASKGELAEALIELVCHYSHTDAEGLKARIDGRSDKANEIVIKGLTIMATKKLRGGSDELEGHSN